MDTTISRQATEDLANASSPYNLVTFRLNRRIYALPIETIEQIILMVTVMPVPQVSDVVEGVINVRGTAVPVVNMGLHFGLPQVALQLNTPIILSHIKEKRIGLIVDEVMGVHRLAADQIAHPADVLPQELGQIPILQGLARISDAIVPLLNPEHLFTPDQVQALAQVMEILATQKKHPLEKVKP